MRNIATTPFPNGPRGRRKGMPLPELVAFDVTGPRLGAPPIDPGAFPAVPRLAPTATTPVRHLSLSRS